MKHLVAFFLPLCIISFIAFGISVAILGTPVSARNPDSVVGSQHTVINESFSRIELKNTSGNLNLYPNDSDSTIITTSSSFVNNVIAYVKNDTLVIMCEGDTWGISSKGFDFSLDTLIDIFTADDQIVNVFVPVKVYNSITSSNLSGRTEILEIPFMLGEFTNTSGTTVYGQPDDFRSERLSVKSGSGVCSIYNADTHTYDVKVSSGYVEAYGLTGKGSVDISSGSCELNYERLDGDIAIDVSSGNLDINLPFDASAEISCDKSSGDVEIDFDGKDKDMDDNEHLTFNGGEYNITVDVSSGDVNISDEVNYELPPLPDLPALVDYAEAVATTALASDTVPAEEITDNYGIHVDDNEVDVDIGLVDVNVNDEKVDVNVGPIDVNVDDENVKVEIGGHTIVDIG